MERRISFKDWLVFKPYDKQVQTDFYYLNVCNEVKQVVNVEPHIFYLEAYLDEKGIDYLSCFLTSYFEDLISETNIWNSFIRMHKSMYQKYLPFYTYDEYFEEEINTADVCFLIWYFINTMQMETFISPFNDFIIRIAEDVMEVFDNAWETAPANQLLNSYYTINPDEKDYYNARKLIDNILFNSYLFFTDTKLDLNEQILEIIKESKKDKNKLSLLNELRDSMLNKNHTRLLSLKAKEWASEINGSSHPVSSRLKNISQKISGYFLYKGQDQTDIFLEHIASDLNFKLTKKSFDHSDKFKELNTIVFMGIIKWEDEWWFSGVFYQAPYNQELIIEEKKSQSSKLDVAFLDINEMETGKLLKSQIKVFKDFNNGKQIAFMPADKIDGFLKTFSDFYINSLKLNDKAYQDALQKIRINGLVVTENEPKNYSKDYESGLVFFNPKRGCEIFFDVNSAFPLDINPYYSEDLSEQHFMDILMIETISPELVMFCIDECKENLPFLKTNAGKNLINEIDFLLRFWKRGNYHTKPAVFLTE